MRVTIGLVLALASATAINAGFAVQHAASHAAAPLDPRRPVRSLRLLVTNLPWLAGWLAGWAGWGLYIGAVAIAPLSLVQAVAAGGIAVIPLAARLAGSPPTDRRESAAIAAAVAGLVVLAATVPAGDHTHHGSTGPVAACIAAAIAAAVVCAGPVSRFLHAGAGLGAAAGLLYAAGDIATKAAFGGRWALIVVVAACHAGGFVALQLSFQRGGVLPTAGLSSLLNNAVPIAAGATVFGEHLPPGTAGAARLVGFAMVVAGGALLARAEPAPAGPPAATAQQCSPPASHSS